MKNSEKVINTWEDFEEAVKNFYSKIKEIKVKNGNSHVSTPLFRGQSDKEWELKPTLDRWQEDFPVEKYHWIIQSLKPAVESLTSKYWQLTEDSKEVVNAIDGPRSGGKIERDYEFMAYLRHTGFPSPLLDWTISPYIAAFFAFNEDKKTDSAIFMYLEYMAGGKIASSDKAAIHSIGPNITTHRRHHLQQCEYTYCIKKIRNTLCYTSHEDAFSVKETESLVDPDYREQDYCEKHILSYKQRVNFLNKLNLMNINAYSLFETEEGLMNKLAIEQFLKDK